MEAQDPGGPSSTLAPMATGNGGIRRKRHNGKRTPRVRRTSGDHLRAPKSETGQKSLKRGRR
jgi:hypothetical protein